MKRLWVALGLLIFVAALCIGALFWQLSAVDRLEQSLEKAETAARQEREDAKKTAEDFLEECMDVAGKLACLSRHVDSIPLRESASQLPILLEQQDYDHFYAETARCRFYLQELRRAEKPLFGNIF